jgi:hypothetical protein
VKPSDPGRQPAPVEHGEPGIRQVGHRDYVGGLWEEIGRLQFDFLVAHGLRPRHVLLDIACGALRGGVHFIPYLQTGHYLGIDKEATLIERGLSEELPAGLQETRRPELLVDAEFDFGRFSRRPEYALAQSLFTHLPPPLIELCLSRLRAVAPLRCRLFATFSEAPEHHSNPPAAHDHLPWLYTRQEMLDFGRRTGWRGRYIGDWRHPRGQVMVEYRPRWLRR